MADRPPSSSPLETPSQPLCAFRLSEWVVCGQPKSAALHSDTFGGPSHDFVPAESSHKPAESPEKFAEDWCKANGYPGPTPDLIEMLVEFAKSVRATHSPEPPKCGSKSHHSEEVCCLESGHTDRHQSENGAKWFDTWEEENSGHRRPHLSESCPKREMAILEESALAMAQSTIQNAMRDANVSNLDSSMLSGNCDLTIRTMARALAACGLEIRFNAVPLSGPPEPPRETEITNHHDMEWALEQRPSSHSPDPTRQTLCRKCSKPQSDSVHKRPIFKGGHYFHPPDENFAPSSHSEPELVKLREALRIAMRQWRGYAETGDNPDLESAEHAEGKIYRSCKAALASTPQNEQK